MNACDRDNNACYTYTAPIEMLVLFLALVCTVHAQNNTTDSPGCVRCSFTTRLILITREKIEKIP
jgi:hypothetical protein